MCMDWESQSRKPSMPRSLRYTVLATGELGQVATIGQSAQLKIERLEVRVLPWPRLSPHFYTNHRQVGRIVLCSFPEVYPGAGCHEK